MTSDSNRSWLALLLGGLVGCSSAAEPTAGTDQRLTYTGTLGWFSERPEGGETCTFRQPDWETAGYLRLRPVSDGELEVYEEAVGCRLNARSEDGQVYAATSATCAWSDGVSLRDLGVVERTFEHWEYNSQSGNLEATGKTVRKTGAGQRMVSCFELHLTVGAASSNP